MTRTEYKAYLRKVQKLQVLAYEHGLDFSFGTRDAETTEGWMTGDVYPEGIDFTKTEMGKDFICFSFYHFLPVKDWDAELARVEKWILEHSQR